MLIVGPTSYIFEYYEVRFKCRPIPPPLYNCITVEILFNIVGHRIDGNYESWKYMGQKTARDRLAPVEAVFLPHPGVRRFFGDVIFFLF